MCKECGRIFCADRCPNHELQYAAWGKRLRRCTACRQTFYQTEARPAYNHLILCPTCLEKLNTKR